VYINLFEVGLRSFSRIGYSRCVYWD